MRFIRKFTEDQRVKIVEEALEYGSNSLVAAKYEINPMQISNLKCCYRRYGTTLKTKEPKLQDKPLPDYKKECIILEKRNKELELEVAVLRDM